MKKGIFITFEGAEGSGKSSVINFLRKYLGDKRSLSVKFLREPGSTGIGEKIRDILLDCNSNISVYTELLLYLAARTQLIEEKLIPALEKYDVVICDRFYDSTVAYQGYGLNLGELAAGAATQFSLGIEPDLTIFLDSDPDKSLARVKNKDRIEQRPREFHYRIQKGYREIARKHPGRVRTINADKSLKEICPEVADIIETVIHNPGKRNV